MRTRERFCGTVLICIVLGVVPLGVYSAEDNRAPGGPAAGTSFGKEDGDVSKKPAAVRGGEAIKFLPDSFPILPWGRLHGGKEAQKSPRHGLASIAECNFTMAGFVTPADLSLCEELGLAAIVMPSIDGKRASVKWIGRSDEEIDGLVKTMVEKSGDSKAILGYYIMDEPGAPAFAALAKVVAAVKRHAPGKLAYINLFPSYATIGAPDKSQLGTKSFREYLERFVNEVKPQILSYDNYMVQYSDDLEDDKKAAIFYHDLLEVRRVALKYNLPFWNIVSSNQIRKFTTIPSPANLLFQAYTTLAAGGRGVSWYTYYGGNYGYAPIDKSGNKTETWRYLRMVNAQVKTLGPLVNRLRSTGVFFTSPPPVESLPLLPGRLVKNVQSRASLRKTTDLQPPLMVGEFSGEDGADYVMVVNLSLEKSTNIVLHTHKEYKSKQVFSAEDGRLLGLDERNGHWLVAGQGALIKLF